MAGFEARTSFARFNSYRKSGGTDHDAICRYLWNVAICESLYPILQAFEISYRNACHVAIGKAYGNAHWLRDPSAGGPSTLNAMENQKIDDAEAEVGQRKPAITEEFLVAELGFGFWSGLLNGHHATMWPLIIASVFPHMPQVKRDQKTAAKTVEKIRRLRNAIAHHRSIWHWPDLADQHMALREAQKWVCPHTARVVLLIDRFPGVFSRGAEGFSDAAAKLQTQPLIQPGKPSLINYSI